MRPSPIERVRAELAAILAEPPPTSPAAARVQRDRIADARETLDILEAARAVRLASAAPARDFRGRTIRPGRAR